MRKKTLVTARIAALLMTAVAFYLAYAALAVQANPKMLVAVLGALSCAFGALTWALLSALNRCWQARAATARQRLRHRRRLAHLSRHDALTGLPNRQFLRARLPRLIEEAQREGANFALLYIDLDNFKDVNDSLGHASGDEFLIAIARRLRAVVAAQDLVVRTGGDEFLVVATSLPHVHVVHSIARRIEQALNAPLEVNGIMLRASLSMGITVYPNDGGNLDELLKNADIALYQAKEHGRGNHQIFTPEMNSRLSERLQFERDLRAAIGTEQLYLEYQPTFDLESERPIGLEALLRWKHPQMGQIPPTRFIPVAEQCGLIVELGAFVLRRVCQQLAEWRSERIALLPVSVNVSTHQLERGRFAETVASLAREYGVDMNLLHFEITESAAMQQSEQHLSTLQALRALGSRILIDDFGTGYSNLTYLKHLPVDTLKIDRMFVRDMATDPNDAAIVSAIIGIAMSLKLRVVAEGVETVEQLRCLRTLGCESAQGFYFRRSISASECLALMKLAAQRRPTETLRLRVLQSA